MKCSHKKKKKNVRGYGLGKQLALLKKALNPPPNQSGHGADKQILEERLKKLPNQQGHGSESGVSGSRNHQINRGMESGVRIWT
jgi:hypothetical protein